MKQQICRDIAKFISMNPPLKLSFLDTTENSKSENEHCELIDLFMQKLRNIKELLEDSPINNKGITFNVNKVNNDKEYKKFGEDSEYTNKKNSREVKKINIKVKLIHTIKKVNLNLKKILMI